jgi:hypothetical protein
MTGLFWSFDSQSQSKVMVGHATFVSFTAESLLHEASGHTASGNHLGIGRFF